MFTLIVTWDKESHEICNKNRWQIRVEIPSASVLGTIKWIEGEKIWVSPWYNNFVEYFFDLLVPFSLSVAPNYEIISSHVRQFNTSTTKRNIAKSKSETMRCEKWKKMIQKRKTRFARFFFISFSFLPQCIDISAVWCNCAHQIIIHLNGIVWP